MHETAAAGLRVGDELAVGRLGLGELALLECEVADELESVVAPGRAEGLLDHAAELRGPAPPHPA